MGVTMYVLDEAEEHTRIDMDDLTLVGLSNLSDSELVKTVLTTSDNKLALLLARRLDSVERRKFFDHPRQID